MPQVVVLVEGTSDLVELGGVVFKTPLKSDDPGFDRKLIRTVIDGVRRL